MGNEKNPFDQVVRPPTKLPLGLIVALLGMFVTMSGHVIWAVWNASAQNTKFEYMVEEMKEMKSDLQTASVDRYHSTDASRDFAIRDQKIGELNGTIQSMQTQMQSSKFERVTEIAHLQSEIDILNDHQQNELKK